MNLQASRSQMEHGELISYETNLVACYEAEYLLSLQYKTNCQCSDHHNANSDPLDHTETMDCDLWSSTNNEKELSNSKNDMNGNVEKVNTRKRQYCDASNTCNCNCKPNVIEQSKCHVVNCSNWCNGVTNSNWYDEHDNNNLMITGRLSPQIKRICFEAQQCQS